MKILAFILPLLLMSGCLSSAEPAPEEEIYEPQVVQEVYDNHSHQFWNVNPMSVANNSIIEFNGSGDLYFTLELTAAFHDPLLWERGDVNYTLMYENETVWSVQDNASITDYTFNMTNVTGNITVQIRASGSDNPTDMNPGDSFIAKARFDLIR